MKLYVDGNDLMDHLAAERDPLLVENDWQRSRANLARWLARYCQASGWEGILVFDENPLRPELPPTEQFGGVTVINLPYAAEAWTEIASPANRNAVQERTLVVTADHRLIRALEHGMARAERPDRFVVRARGHMRSSDQTLSEEPDEKFTGLTDDEVGFWLEYFSDED